MAVKYRCTKCDRKFVDWGVNKVKSGKACKDCHGEYLEKIGYDAAQATPRKKPALKRKRARMPVEAEVPVMTSYDDDAVAPNLDTLTTPDSGAAVEEMEGFEDTRAVAEADTEEAEEEESTGPAAVDDDDAADSDEPTKDDEE